MIPSFLNVYLYKKADYKMPKLSTVMYYPSFSYMDEHSIAIVTDIPDENTEENANKGICK